MTNYQEDRGSFPEGSPNPTGADQHEGGAYQGAPGYQGGSSAYQGGGQYGGGQYGGGPETSHYSGGDQPQWAGQQPQGQPYQGQGQGQGHQGGLQGMLHGGPMSGQGSKKNIRSTFKTTEFWIFVVVSLALLIAAAATDQGSDNQGFSAHDAWKYVTWLAIAYIISRGLTKFGGHERDDDRDRH